MYLIFNIQEDVWLQYTIHNTQYVTEYVEGTYTPNRDISRCKHNITDRHNIPSPWENTGQWLSTILKERVGSLYKTEEGFPGHLEQLQDELNRCKPRKREEGLERTPDIINAVRKIKDSVIKATKAAIKDGKINFSGIKERFRVLKLPLGIFIDELHLTKIQT